MFPVLIYIEKLEKEMKKKHWRKFQKSSGDGVPKLQIPVTSLSSLSGITLSYALYARALQLSETFFNRCFLFLSFLFFLSLSLSISIYFSFSLLCSSLSIYIYI